MLRRYAHLSHKDGLAALLKGLGLERPPEVDLGRLQFDDETLRPVVPMNPPPRTRAEVERTREAVLELLGDPDLLAQLLEWRRQAQASWATSRGSGKPELRNREG